MKYLIPDHVLEERIGDEIVLLSLKRETFFSLNASGIYLWSELKMGRTEAELAQGLADAHGLELERAAADVRIFAAELARLELIAVMSD